MSFRCLSRAELICWSFHSLILIEIFGVFLPYSLLHISPSVSLLLHPLLSRFRVFLSHFSAFSCGAPRPLSLALVAHFFFLFLLLFSAPSNRQLEAFLVCLFPLLFFSFVFLIMKNVFISLSLSSIYLLPLCVLWPHLVSRSRFPCLFFNLFASVTGYL